MDDAQTKQPRTFDDQGRDITPPPPPKAPRINLHNADAIRQEMASVYRDMRNGLLESSEGTKLTYVLQALIKAYEVCVLERNVELLKLATQPPKESKK